MKSLEAMRNKFNILLDMLRNVYLKDFDKQNMYNKMNITIFVL